MSAITNHNLPDDLFDAIQARAALHGCSTEDEILSILEDAVRPKNHTKLGTMLATIANEAGALTHAEAEALTSQRDKTPSEPLRFE